MNYTTYLKQWNRPRSDNKCTKCDIVLTGRERVYTQQGYICQDCLNILKETGK